MRLTNDDRLRVTYRLRCDLGETPRAKALEIAYEQTVELPAACVGEAITHSVVGRIESVESNPVAGGTAVISYAPELIGNDAAQLANLLFGNISLKHGILITAIEWPQSLVNAFGGPSFGVAGVRAMTATPPKRPLLCAALKPLGLGSADLAALCYRFAAGGIDLIKDDHGLADQASAPFAERVERCQEAVQRANLASGGSTLYVPNITGRAASFESRLKLAQKAGCKIVMMSPFLDGLDRLQQIARKKKLAVLAHPAFSGTLFSDTHGIAPQLVLGDLFRLLGADGAIYPNVGGRFPFSDRTCHAINAHLRQELGTLRPAFPVPGGGIDVKIVPHWLGQYGPDTILLIGGSLYLQGDLTVATRNLVSAVEKASESVL